MVQKSLDAKLARIHADPHGCKDFILADAKDADMALSIGAPGRSPEAHSGEVRYRTLAEFRDVIEQIVEQELVDIMLMSASTSEALTIQKRIFDNSPVTPAARANDTTDIHIVRGGRYPAEAVAAVPHRDARSHPVRPSRLQAGGAPPRRRPRPVQHHLQQRHRHSTGKRWRSTSSSAWRPSARAFAIFWKSSIRIVPKRSRRASVPDFINDAIVRTLGGVTAKGRPLFLKMVYHGPKAMEELVHYDPHLVVGILGGSAGTTYDAFKLLSEAKKYGARVALFGRKINNAENQFAFIRFLRWIADGEISAEEAVQAYHGVLQKLGIKPQRSLEDDMKLQTNVMSYGGNGKTISVPESPRVATRGLATKKDCGCGCNGAGTCPPKTAKPSANGEPDFKTMTAAQKVAYHKARWDRILGQRIDGVAP